MNFSLSFSLLIFFQQETTFLFISYKIISFSILFYSKHSRLKDRECSRDLCDIIIIVKIFLSLFFLFWYLKFLFFWFLCVCVVSANQFYPKSPSNNKLSHKNHIKTNVKAVEQNDSWADKVILGDLQNWLDSATLQ